MKYTATPTSSIREGEDFPNLLLIDGGKGQLRAVVEVLGDELGISDTESPVVSLAKREEEVFIPGSSFPVTALKNPNSKPMLLLRGIRDEAHRFAVSFHRRKRKKAALQSGDSARISLAPMRGNENQAPFPI